MMTSFKPSTKYLIHTYTHLPKPSLPLYHPNTTFYFIFTPLRPVATMASLNTSTNGPSIKSSYSGVVNSAAPSGAAASSPTYGQWALFSVSAPLVNAFQQDGGGKESVLKVQSTGGTFRFSIGLQ